MMRIGKMVEMRAHAGEQGFLSYTCSPDDVAILISYSGETNEMVELAKFLKKMHVPFWVLLLSGIINYQNIALIL